MSEEENNPNIVQIHLNVEQNGDTLHVDFQFDIVKDDLDSVVNDLIATLGYQKDSIPMFKKLISDQIKAKVKDQDDDDDSEYNQTSPPESPQNSAANFNSSSQQVANLQNISDDDEEFLNDPEYIQLLQKQEKEIKELEARQLNERQMLEQKLASKTNDDDLLIF